MKKSDKFADRESAFVFPDREDYEKLTGDRFRILERLYGKGPKMIRDIIFSTTVSTTPSKTDIIKQMEEYTGWIECVEEKDMKIDNKDEYDITKEGEEVFEKFLNLLLKEKKSQKYIKTEKLIEEFLEELDMDHWREARKLMNYTPNSTDRNPRTIAASIIYIIDRVKGDKMDDSEIEDNFGVSPDTVIDCHEEFAESIKEEGYNPRNLVESL